MISKITSPEIPKAEDEEIPQSCGGGRHVEFEEDVRNMKVVDIVIINQKINVHRSS